MIILRPLCSLLLTPALPCPAKRRPPPFLTALPPPAQTPYPYPVSYPVFRVSPNPLLRCHLGFSYTRTMSIPSRYIPSPSLPLSNTSASQPGIGFLSNQSVVEWLAWFRKPILKNLWYTNQTASEFYSSEEDPESSERRAPLPHLYMTQNVVSHVRYKWVAANASVTRGRFEGGNNPFVSE